MRIGDVVREAVALVADVAGCARHVVARVGAPLAGALGWLVTAEPSRPAAGDGNRSPEAVRERVEAAKFTAGTAPGPAPVVDRELGSLPRAYGVDRAVLLPRDPWWVFAYWEVSPVTRIETLRRLGPEAEDATETLRVHVADGVDVTSFDVVLPPGVDRWHVEAGRPGATVRVEVGIRTRAGRFVPLVASAAVTTMPAAPAAETRLEWVDLEPDGPRTVPPPVSAPSPSTRPWPVIAAPGSSDVHARLRP
jgi:hypothetical protein